MSVLFSGLTRSQLMSRIRARGNARTELAFASLLKSIGIKGWRRHQPILGTPDFSFKQPRLCIFIDGCFWHGCPLHSTHVLKQSPLWQAKIYANRRRDKNVSRELRKNGWRVLRIWEHELAKKNRTRLLARLRRAGLIARNP